MNSFVRTHLVKLAVLFLSFSAHAATPKANAPAKSALPKLLQQIETKYVKASTLRAEFTQENEFPALNQKKTSTGLILVKRPNKLRWETYQPDQNLMVSDGKRFWYYTPPFDEEERGQYIEKRSSEVNSRLANALLSGHFSSAKEMKIEKKADNRFVLVPKKGTAGTVVRAELEVDPEKLLIRKVVLEHSDKNRSEIALKDIKLGEPIQDDLFVFVPPPNTDKMESATE